MHTLQTAILQHTTATGVHHDWLIEDPTRPDPRAPNARLWTARITPPPKHWPQLKRFDLTITPPHRRFYLDYQGPVSGNRGHVKRLAQGTCQARLWSDRRILISIQDKLIQISLQLTRRSGDHWLAIVDAACESA